MTLTQINDRIKKTNEKLTSLSKTLARHQKQADKKLAKIKENGWDPNNRYCQEGKDDYGDSYWLICEYQDKLDDIKRVTKKYEETWQQRKLWQEKLNEQKERNEQMAKIIPPVLQLLQKELVEEWTKYDLEAKAQMLNDRTTMGVREYYKKYSDKRIAELNKLEEEFREINEFAASTLVIDLFYRIKDITGPVKRWNDIHFEGNALNGFVEGEIGKAIVTTIIAGGYNIQRMHYRVLVKKAK